MDVPLTIVPDPDPDEDSDLSPQARDRLLILSGKDPSRTLSNDGDLSDALPVAKMTLIDVMTDRSNKAVDRVAAADSVLDRVGQPRRKHEMGGSRQIVFNLQPTAVGDALRGMASLFKGDSDDPKLSPLPSADARPVHSHGLAATQPDALPDALAARGGG